MYRRYQSIALVLAVLVQKSGKTRLRISRKTFCLVSGRKTVREGLIANVKEWLEDYGVLLFSLERGGYALIASSALEGAPSLSLKRGFSDWRSWNDAQLAAELGIEYSEDEEE